MVVLDVVHYVQWISIFRVSLICYFNHVLHEVLGCQKTRAYCRLCLFFYYLQCSFHSGLNNRLFFRHHLTRQFLETLSNTALIIRDQVHFVRLTLQVIKNDDELIWVLIALAYLHNPARIIKLLSLICGKFHIQLSALRLHEQMQ